MRPIALILALILPVPLAAQSFAPPPGIGFVQAPEQYSGTVIAADPAAAAEAAAADCAAAGAEPVDCVLMAWCQPAGWSIDLFVQHAEGPHWHEFHCGLPSAGVARGVADALCDPGARPYEMIACGLAQIYDPDGRPTLKR
jgi:hypothetical protein